MSDIPEYNVEQFFNQLLTQKGNSGGLAPTPQAPFKPNEKTAEEERNRHKTEQANG